MRRLIPPILVCAALAPAPALAQESISDAIERQIAAMQAEIARLSAEVAELKAERAAGEAPPPPPAAIPAAAPAAPSTAPASQLAWKGAPEQTSTTGFTFKPRGRLQIDSGVIDAPEALGTNGLGAATEFRRAYLGMEGTLPGKFGYRIEADFANSAVDLADVFLTYRPSDALVLTLGHHKPFGGIDEMTSDLFTPFMERAAFTSAFGFERRVGLSGTYSQGEFLLQAGVFADDARSLNDGSNNSYSLDGRVVFSPELGDGRLHLAGSAHYREFNDATDVARYRARPFLHTTDVRLIDTGEFSATGERNFGAELAYIRGPFHVTAEGHTMTALRPALDDVTFWGGYVEVGMLLTGEDKTVYRSGTYDRIRPGDPVTEGGIGAIQLNARYDRIYLSDGAIVGGQQQTLGLSAIWMLTDYVRFLLNYGHIWVDDAAIPAETNSDYQVDAVGLRAQIDF